MTTPTIADTLKYANLQMAAEAFIRDPVTYVLSGSGTDLIDALKTGNNHASRFTETQAEAFADPVTGWTVLDQSIRLLLHTIQEQSNRRMRHLLPLHRIH